MTDPHAMGPQTFVRPVTRRQARTDWLQIDLSELWHHRELVYFYALRDIKVKYKQTLLGAAWAVLQPVLTMAVFAVFIGRAANLATASVPYPIFMLCALLPWQLFAYALTQSSLSLVQDAEVLRKIYFPRVILPIASVLAGLLDFAIAFAVLLVAMAIYGVVPGLAIIALPLVLILVLAAALAAGFWMAALNVQYRDVRYALPFLAQIWFFLTPVAYSSSVVRESWRFIYSLNPMVGVVESFRWAMLNEPPPSLVGLLSSTAVTVVLFLSGLIYFRRTERHFADLV
jgi:lipopolysaccharide transport system permease protein